MDMNNAASKVGHGLAAVLGIKLDDAGGNNGIVEDGLREEETLLAPTITSGSGAFIEGQPTSREWIQEQLPSRDEISNYARSLLPCLSWVGHYNLQWLASDMVAGITIGAVVVPQGMAYAMLAKLDPQYGLYSSFMGVMLYWLLGTSKDISIGPVAVLSTLVGNVVNAVNETETELSSHAIASALSIVSGAIVLLIGLLRWGWIVDLISITCLSAFMTGSAIAIAASQLPALLGVTGFSNREAPYKVIINVVKHLPEATQDAVLGLSALFILYFIRNTLTKAAVQFPKRRRIFFFINTMRTVAVILFYTILSFFINRNRRDDPAFDVLGHVPKGVFLYRKLRI